MHITLNGASHEIEAGASVAALVAKLGLTREQVAVEQNRQLVPRAQHAQALLKEGDEVEVVTLVGGG